MKFKKNVIGNSAERGAHDIYAALIASELYLFFTLIVFVLGPVSYRVHNASIFYTLIFLYHVSFIAGYLLSVRTGKTASASSASDFSALVFYVVFSFGLVSLLLTYQNAMLGDTLIPRDFFENLARGVTDPAAAYVERMGKIEEGLPAGSRVQNVVSFAFAFCKLFFVFYSIYHWGVLTRAKRALFISYSFFYLSIGLSAGINSVVFQYFIFTSITILLLMYINSPRIFRRAIFLFSILSLVPIISFGYIMSERGGDVDFIAAASPLGEVGMRYAWSENLNATNPFGFIQYSLVWLSSYLVQGYYGFSLILSMDFNWTYGFGNSAFMQRQLEMLTGVDVGPYTFQHRVSSIWDENAQWHSFYGQFANDFSLPGVCLLMFMLGYYLAAAWRSVVLRNSLFGAAILPIFALLVIFIPANNQVFGFIDTFSYFFFISLFFFFEGKKIRWKKNVQ